MRLISFSHAATASWGILDGDAVIDCASLAPTLRAALPQLAELTARASGLPRIPLSEITYLPPIPDPDKIICVGLNYLSHILEGGREPPKQPTIFTRWANSQIGHNQPIIRPKISETLDFEGELAVVISQTCRHVAEADAERVIAGFSCYNDGSVREWQRHSSQFGPRQELPRHRRLRPRARDARRSG